MCERDPGSNCCTEAEAIAQQKIIASLMLWQYQKLAMLFCIPIPSLLYHLSTFSLPLTCITHAQTSLPFLFLPNLFLLLFLLPFYSFSVISYQTYQIFNLHVFSPCYHLLGETVFLHIFHIK